MPTLQRLLRGTYRTGLVGRPRSCRTEYIEEIRLKSILSFHFENQFQNEFKDQLENQFEIKNF